MDLKNYIIHGIDVHQDSLNFMDILYRRNGNTFAIQRAMTVTADTNKNVVLIQDTREE